MVSFNLNSTAPNQEFSITIDGHTAVFTLKTAYDMLFATIKVDDTVVKTNGRCCANQWLIPYMSYVPDDFGNFMFITKDDEYPNYQNFNSTCILAYATRKEYDAQ